MKKHRPEKIKLWGVPFGIFTCLFLIMTFFLIPNSVARGKKWVTQRLFIGDSSKKILLPMDMDA